ncbi:glycosyltransferase [Streptosporangium lutulentum]
MAFCDDDDEWLPGKIPAQIELISRHPDAVAAGCGVEVRSDGHSVTRLSPYPVVTFQHLLRDRVMELHPRPSSSGATCWWTGSGRSTSTFPEATPRTTTFSSASRRSARSPASRRPSPPSTGVRPSSPTATS